MSQGAQLKRSQKTDFSAAAPFVTRERSFIRPNKDPQKRRSQTMATIKGKPTMEIYRPPNVRTDLPNVSGKLNVHAKEFTMNHELHSSKSSGNLNLAMGYEPIPLQHSKSSGNILRHINHPGFVPILPGVPLPLLHSSSTSHVLNHIPRPNYQYAAEIMAHPVFSGLNQPIYHSNWNNNQSKPISNAPIALKRSKSLGATDSKNLAAKLKSIAKEEIDLSMFSSEEQTNLKAALEDPNQLATRSLMDLVKIIMEKVVEGIKFCEPIAKLCISIIENEKNQTFLESLLNMCQQWYQERDKILRGIKAGDGTRFTAFMWFLTELCSQIKRHQLKDQFESMQPDLVLLSILAKCCQACVSLPIKCLSETECLFFVLTSIGRDLEAELPQQLEQLLASVRDGFLASAGSTSVRRTLLQLIELHASNWQLPGSSVLYYYPRIK
ncbi:CBP80/20-dependent translation initiation factor [Anoplophora glabripennis]|uniref:CBP80/20-dependent translation initiation factor n=1 Tax=Anoplophora glabripennis TaxID=217634 RepID=UPI0008741B2E|nr:CBP80/20-dependent translation initiation factor [Anoplophora glabripennis]